MKTTHWLYGVNCEYNEFANRNEEMHDVLLEKLQ